MDEPLTDALVTALPGRTPAVDPAAWVAPGAVVVGDVHLGAEVGIWYAAVLRADLERIEVGAGSNVQDGSALHADPGFPLVLGTGVSVGHRAVLHGCTIEDDVLVGMGAIVMNGARVGAGSILGAGACVPQGMQVPPRSLVLGLPGKVRGEVDDDALAASRVNAATYRDLLVVHRTAHG